MLTMAVYNCKLQQMKNVENEGPLTIADVAREAGVSTATVSRVLNGRNTVSQDAVKRVKSAVERIGYKFPLPASRRGPKPVTHPAGLKHGVFAFLWTGGQSGRHAASMQTGQSLLKGVSRGMRNRQIDLSVLYLDDEHEQLLPALESGKVDGLILQGPPLSAALSKRLERLPSVWLLYSGSHEWGDRVQPDHREVGNLVFAHFLKQGLSPVCCMTYQAHAGAYEYWTERGEAFLQQARIAKVDHVVLGQDLPACTTDGERVAAARRLVDQFMALPVRPKGLFLAMNDLGGFVADELTQRGVQLMKDVILFTGDIESPYRSLRAPAITVDIRSVEIGFLAVEVLLARIANPSLPRLTELIEPRLIIP